MSNSNDLLHIALGSHELRIIRLSLNEVANGFPLSDDELLARTGYTRQEILDVLQKLRPAKQHKGSVRIDVEPPR